ncbi:hypothetical protein MBLNU459_g2854t1 [Dothideomycetes sp. NU459]
MVLENATSGDSFTGDAPSSDADPYSPDSAPSGSFQASAAAGAQSYRIKLDQLPKAMYPMNGEANRRATIHSITENCRHASAVLKRPLNQDEVDAIAFHFAKSIRVVSIGIPAGIALGLLTAWRGRRQFSFPGWKMKEGSKFNPDEFGPLVKGPRARAAWHAVRANIYGLMGGLVGMFLMSTYATTLNAVGTTSDPRLQDYINALRSRAEEQRGKQQPQGRPVGQRNPVTSQEGRMDEQARRAAQRIGMETQYNRQNVQRKVADYDDMSPTSGSWANENSSVSSDTGLLSDSQMRSQEQRQQSDSNSSVSNDNRPNTFQMDKVTPQSRGFDQDDASPTVGAASNSGSSWDRIRREAASGKHASQQPTKARPWPTADRDRNRVNPEQRQGSTSDDSFSFSETDEERQLAKREAQKDFDARIERERNGGEFTEGSKTGGWRR